MLPRASVEELNAHLRRTNGARADDEIVRWLRECAPLLRDTTFGAQPSAAQGYTRSRMYAGPGFEILLLRWNAGAVTPVHDHGGAKCWFVVVDGNMRVDNFTRIDRGSERGFARITHDFSETLGPGGMDYRADDVHLHRCATPQATTTLHVYAGPIERYNVFDDRTSAVQEVPATYD